MIYSLITLQGGKSYYIQIVKKNQMIIFDPGLIWNTDTTEILFFC